jgi:hypothetical protein
VLGGKASGSEESGSEEGFIKHSLPQQFIHSIVLFERFLRLLHFIPPFKYVYVYSIEFLV